jgi:hypothetical protein
MVAIGNGRLFFGSPTPVTRRAAQRGENRKVRGEQKRNGDLHRFMLSGHAEFS